MKRLYILLPGTIFCILAFFLFFPLVHVFRQAFFPDGRFSAVFFRNLVVNPIMREAIFNSFALATVATVMTAILALPLAFFNVRFSFPAKNVIGGLLLTPMIMPPFVGAVGMRQFLARFGTINLLLMDWGVIASPVDWLGAARFWGVAIVMALHLYPVMYLNVTAGLANVDPALEEAAVNMGSGGWSLFRRVTLPLMMPGLFAGSIIVFIWALTDLGTPLVFEYRRVMAVQIFDRVTDMNSNPEGSALVALVLVLTLAVFVAGKRLFGASRGSMLRKGGSRSAERDPGTPAKILILLFFAATITVSALPHLSVILTSLREKWFMTVLPESFTFQHYRNALGHELTLPSIRNSIMLSSMSTFVDLLLGVTVAYILVRKPFKGSDILDGAVMLPLAIPGIVLAFGYVGSFAGTILDPRENPMPLLVIAYAVRRLPYMVRAAYAGFQQVSSRLEEAGVNLGSSAFRVTRRVTLPLISANLIAGGILAFSFAMLEVSDSLILAVKEQFFPITKTIYHLLARIEDGSYIAAALGVWAMLFLALSLVAGGILLGRRMGRLFRV